MAKEIERAGIPVALVTAMWELASQVGAPRIVRAIKIAHPCGDPALSAEENLAQRRAILNAALGTLEQQIAGPIVVSPSLGV
ncbi:MAG: hypothetical protein HY675_14860 [Chloroflexi bacterium]|nr:hypothetical protein [Chloroflexota bacterium]